jgi:hypothetical protein
MTTEVTTLFRVILLTQVWASASTFELSTLIVAVESRRQACMKPAGAFHKVPVASRRSLAALRLRHGDWLLCWCFKLWGREYGREG